MDRAVCIERSFLHSISPSFLIFQKKITEVKTLSIIVLNLSIVIQKQRTDYVPKPGIMSSIPPAPTPPPPAPALPTYSLPPSAPAPIEHHGNSPSNVSRQSSSTSSDNGSITMREQKEHSVTPANRTHAD